MTRSNPYHGFRFVVQVDQVMKGGFSRVRGLARETRVESFTVRSPSKPKSA